ncbi:SDR family NAD(P)-dependent oxidoreductase [Halomarina halobia]|uniref:SDR family NAD(P)-dependent oxidoreductase n=1 Tax=Halomarina halobia TaxID=3033386 RepID=A0ABD6AFS3_9EURY|nr:SDR family oxidoreductase [Halomarina sp. PSR21]
MLDSHVAFVTGASQGIGRAIAVALAERGASVALAARGDGIYETAEEIGDAAPTLPVETDVTDEAAVEAAVEETVAELGGLDLLVNNAGIGGPTAMVEDVSREEWQETQDVNVLGSFLTVKHAVPSLRESDCASIVNISSIAGKDPYPSRTPYAASKAALIGFGRSLAYELGEDGVTVNTICPGAVEGERVERMIQRQADRRGVSFERAMRDRVTDRLPLDSIVDPADIGALVAFLGSEYARNITAQDINVDSGARQD